MRLYLDPSLGKIRELCAGSPHPIMVERDESGYRFIEGGEKERKALIELGWLVDEASLASLSDKPEIASEEEGVNAADLQNFALQPSAAPAGEPPTEYKCKKHKRVHKQGSSAYVQCWEANFGRTGKAETE